MSTTKQVQMKIRLEPKLKAALEVEAYEQAATSKSLPSLNKYVVSILEARKKGNEQ